jgi:phosphoenolpyruvate carboxylase
MNYEDPYREDLQVIDRELRNHYEYRRQLEDVNYRIAEIDAQLTSIGSPKIMSTDEAKYQKGTRIYSDINMLELFQEQDLLIKQKQDLLYLISRVQVKLNKLDEVDMQLIEQRYKYKKTLRELAQNTYNGKSTMSRKLDDILLKLNTFH